MNQARDDDEFSSEVSGSWSRVKAIKYNQRLNLANKLLTTQNGDEKNGPLVHRVTAVAKLDSYDREPTNLNAVEAFVRSKSGHPKITSISLKYDVGSSKSKFKPLNFSNRLSEHAAQAPEPVSAPCEDIQHESVKQSPEATQATGPAHTDVVTDRNQPCAGRISVTDCEEIPIPVIVERKSSADKTGNETRKKVLKSVQQTKMPSSQPATPLRKITSKKVEDYRLSHRHRSVSPKQDSASFTPVEPRATKSQEKVLSAKPVEARVKRDTRRADAGQRKNLFDSGRDSWLNTPKDQDQKRCSHQQRYQTESDKKRAKRPVKDPAEPKSRLDSGGTEFSILEELTKAADEILLAVNGCTDDDSDDERKTDLAVKSLGAIPEKPSSRRLRTAVRCEARLKSRTGPEPTEVTRDSKNSIDERNRRRQARVSLNKESRGHVASSSEEIESAAEIAAATKMKRIVRKSKSQAIKTVSGQRGPLSGNQKPMERVYQVDYQEEEKQTGRRLSVRENGLRKRDCTSMHRRRKTSEPDNTTDDLRITSNSHSESRKGSHRTVRGSLQGQQKCDSRDKKTSTTSKSRTICSSK